MILIKDILNINKISVANASSLKQTSYSGVSIDSRNIKPSELFIAIKGENTDGHDYINEVINKKINGAIVNKKWFAKNKSKYKGMTFYLADETAIALGELARNHKRNYSVAVLCISGSNGKTTTKDLIAEVLNKKFNTLKTEGNFNNHIGLPLTLLKLNDYHEICVLETGSNHFNELKYLCEICEPDFALVTNIGMEHLEFFKTIEGVAKEEFTIFDYVSKKNFTCFANIDDEHIIKYFKTNKYYRVVTYSLKKQANIKGKLLGFDNNFRPKIEISTSKGKFTTNVGSAGIHSVINGLAAAAVGTYFDVSNNAIKSALSGYKPEGSKRMELITKNGFKVINDTYNSNPDSVKIGLDSLKIFKTKGKKHVVLGDMLEMGKSSKKVHSYVGKLVKEMGFQNLYTYGTESYNTFKSAKGVGNNYYFSSKDELTEFLRLNVKNSDVVYVKGSRGMKMEDIVNHLIN
ncbi:UDP-N-acetylmuramoyl-tripeptide--D-alanyl-D-alanine ligase [bacterium]|nr:MAG: UDP-N-acetylmuramoyl-tripeptide--D-alanyl-D-alanine ligase [bacterium]